MIAYLMLGKTIADALPTGGTQFTDVPANFWGAKYIQYCANEGIINGYGNGKFGPDDELTSTQWSLMLLGALGYEAKNEGIGGTGWEIATTKLAMKAGVASAEDMVGAMTRDTAAKMAFNTLKANMVEYQSNGTNITVGDTNINVGASKAEPLTTTKEYGDNISADGADGTVANPYTVQFGEQHFPKLVLTASTPDSLGRPASKWVNDKADIGTYANAPVLTLTTKTSVADVTKALKGYVMPKDAKDAIYSKAVGTGANLLTGNYAGGTMTSLITGVAGATANGSIVEVYANSSKEITATVEIVPAFVEVTTISTAANNAHGAYTTYNAGVLSGKVYSSVVDADNDVDTAFVTGEVENGDMVLAYKDGANKLHIEALDTVSGVLTSVSNKNVATIDGEKYNIANGVTLSASKDTNTFYVDARGNVWGAVKDTAKNFAIVMSTEKYSKLDGNKVVDAYSAVLAFADGTYETVEYNHEKSSKNVVAGWAVTYSVKDGVYTLTGLSGEGLKRVVDIESLKTNTIAVDNKDSMTDRNVKYYNNATKFLVATYTKKDADYTLTGATLYTGIANAPTYNTLGEAYALDTSATPDGIADLVVVLDRKSATMADSYVYLTGAYNDTADGREYVAFIKGEETTVTGSTAHVEAQGMYKEYNSDNDNTLATATSAYVQYKGGLLTLDDNEVKTIAEDAPVYIIDATTSTVSASVTTVSALANKLTGDVFVVDGATAGSVSAVYVVLK